MIVVLLSLEITPVYRLLPNTFRTVWSDEKAEISSMIGDVDRTCVRD